MILLYNPDVGSGLEYVGDIIKSWIDDVTDQYVEVKVQDHPLHLIKQYFNPTQPNFVIVNEEHESICVALCYYKLFHPDIKIIYIYHVWQNIVYMHQNRMYKDVYKRSLLDLADHIICVNYPPDEIKFPKHLVDKIYKGFMPMDPTIYYPKVPWQSRQGLFMYLGNIIPQKVSVEFLQKIQKTSITIDCYGKLSNIPEYIELFNSCNNMVCKGYIDQSKVTDILNQYKFFVMPHHGQEPFNISMLQAIMCGTIPLVVNDRNSEKFSPSWIDWAKDLYYENNTVDEFIENLIRIVNEDDISNCIDISTNISRQVNERFDYGKFKKDFIDLIKTY